MIGKIKRFLYFPVASYFKLFASIQLLLWRPRVFVVTGSYGKTTLLELIKAGLGDKARYSDHANSAFGIPFDILGLHRKTLKPDEWIWLFLSAPFKAFKKPYKEKMYIVEADCDRPGEGLFLAKLLKPETTLWISSSVTHSMNFDHLVGHGFNSVDKAIAREFGYFAEYAKSLVIANGDSELILAELKRTKAPVELVNENQFDSYKLGKKNTEFGIDGKKYEFDVLLPRENFYSIAMAVKLFTHLGIDDFSFDDFTIPPGRSSVFDGIKNTTLLDSSYNTPAKGMESILEMYQEYPAKPKWAVIGDMLELGKHEAVEHESLAAIIKRMDFDRVILIGPRVSKYTYPILKKKMGKEMLVCFTNPKEVLDYLNAEIKGGETILFKGARFLEGVIENLLKDKSDVAKLPRREEVWRERRKKWGL